MAVPSKPSRDYLLDLHKRRTGDTRSSSALRRSADTEEARLKKLAPRIAVVRRSVMSEGVEMALEIHELFLEWLMQDDPWEYTTKEVLDRMHETEQDAIRTINSKRNRADEIELEQMESGYSLWRDLRGSKRTRRTRDTFKNRPF